MVMMALFFFVAKGRIIDGNIILVAELDEEEDAAPEKTGGRANLRNADENIFSPSTRSQPIPENNSTKVK